MFLVLEAPPAGVTKVSTLTRCIARGIDLAVILFTSVVLPYPLGIFLGFLYTLIQDGIHDGRSLGKWLFHLKVIRIADNEPCTLRDSVIRNAPLGVATFFGIIPIWGWIILVLLGVPLVALEVYLMLTLANGGRLGDVMADTRVVEAPRTARHPKAPPKKISKD